VGVGIHHAGLSMEDRRLIEQRFLAGKLFVVVATSTLAVGVNLPCHTVIIKGVEMWDGSKTKEYPDLDVVQMMGRAVCSNGFPFFPCADFFLGTSPIWYEFIG
jgi:ATP-dependent DNA helicase HFM1/MER3